MHLKWCPLRGNLKEGGAEMKSLALTAIKGSNGRYVEIDGNYSCFDNENTENSRKSGVNRIHKP